MQKYYFLMKAKTLYISDLDGTLLNNDSVVSRHSARIITQLSEKGAMITVATARTPATADILLADCKINVPMIVVTGAAMWSHSEKIYISAKTLERSLLDTLLKEFDEYGISPFVYSFDSKNGFPSLLDVYHKSPIMNPRETDFFENRKKLKKFFIGEDISEKARDNALLLFAIGKTESIMPVADSLRSKNICSMSAYPDIFDESSSQIEVFAPGVSKANAVLKLKEMTGADRVVVFGDNLNDISMMSVADVAVAVENAYPQVKEAADIVIGRNTEDAVAKFIKEDFEK